MKTTFKTLLGCVLAAATLVGCDTSDLDAPDSAALTNASEPKTRAGSASGKEYTEFPILKLSTDKVCYKPGETVNLSVEGSLNGDARLRVTHGSTVVEDIPYPGNSWSWTAPGEDFTGYLIQVYSETDAEYCVYGSVGVDVSSDWGRFPRYGFVSDYDQSKTPEQIAKEVKLMNRLHLNGVQFYDWLYMHHQPVYPYGENYTDIAGREVRKEAVRGYIDALHGVGAKCMFYDLAYGTFENADRQGADAAWGWYDYFPKKGVPGDYELGQCYHDLRTTAHWKSNIMLMDPANRNWQNYMKAQLYDVYNNFNFDGFHIDQLGKVGDNYYNSRGERINIEAGLGSFARAMKDEFPRKDIVVNSVSKYASKEIMQSGAAKFAYNEVWWGKEEEFDEFYRIMKANKKESGNPNLSTVFAAYMGKKHPAGYTTFNPHGVLLTDAVIFALGCSHIEMSGTHMLNNEYFPNKDLKMSDDLLQKVITYYDFLTAYENYLREDWIEFDASLTSEYETIKPWKPEPGALVTYSHRNYDNSNTINLLNFKMANSLNWRDSQGTQAKPMGYVNLDVSITDDEPVKKVWVASPDAFGGAPVELNFKHENNKLSFTIPAFDYWAMIVVEHGTK